MLYAKYRRNTTMHLNNFMDKINGRFIVKSLRLETCPYLTSIRDSNNMLCVT